MVNSMTMNAFDLAQALASPAAVGCGVVVAVALLIVVSWYLREAGIFREASLWLHEESRRSETPEGLEDLLADYAPRSFKGSAVKGFQARTAKVVPMSSPQPPRQATK